MANWAVVIGVDKYWQPDKSLRGAVRDALEMRKWLLDPAGGNVPGSNLSLHLEPDRIPPPGGLRFLDARRDTIVTGIERLLTRSGGRGKRLFFHFSGHGLTQRINFSNLSAILASDFSDILTTNSFTLSSLFELFQGTQFEQQFFFIDACRNIPFDTEKRLGEYPNPREPVPPVSPQFVMYATQPGAKAIEIRSPGDEQGAFTGALREGLRGNGSAKRWDEEKGEYVVRWNSLFEHVESTVKARKLPVGSPTPPAGVPTPPTGPLIQEPKQYGERGSDDPELGRFPQQHFPNETLQIDLDPAGLRDRAHVAVGELAKKNFEQGPPVADLPVTVRLPPRTYAVLADAPGYAMRKTAVKVDLYLPKRVTVELIPAMPVPPSPSGAGPSCGPSPTFTLPGPSASINLPTSDRFEGTGRAIAAKPEATSTIEVFSRDALAQLELAKASGQVMTAGRGSLRAWDVSPGFYRARLISPEGVAVEELIEVSPGADRIMVNINAPLPTSEAMKWAMEAGGFDVQDDGTVEPSESVKPAAFLKLSTILALAAGASLEGANAPYGHKLRGLRIPAFYPDVSGKYTSGFMMLFGDEAGDPRCWQQTEIRCSPQTSNKLLQLRNLLSLDGAPGIARASFGALPGSYWVSFKLSQNEELHASIAVLPDRATLLVLTREADGSLELHQYQPALGDPSSDRASYEQWKKRDPEFSESRFAALRRIELMQRSVTHGRFTPNTPDIDALLYDKWVDPIAGCLGGYLLVRMGRTEELEIPARNLVHYFGTLPDAHVLNGAYLEAVDRKQEARAAYLVATACGVPIYRDGLALLRSALARLDARDESENLLRDFLDLVPAGSLWSASRGLGDGLKSPYLNFHQRP